MTGQDLQRAEAKEEGFMFVKDRESLINVLHIIQRQHCSYDMMSIGVADAPEPSMCDCKYGYVAEQKGRGEKTGCPELRCAVELLTLMTDDEYDTILSRTHHIRI